MGCNAAYRMDCLEVQKEAPAMFPDYKHMVIN